MLRYLGMWMLMSCYMKSPDYFWHSAARMTGDDMEDEENDILDKAFDVVAISRLGCQAKIEREGLVAEVRDALRAGAALSF